MQINFKDKEAYDYLLSFDLFPNKQEGFNYLNDAYIRLKETIKIIPDLNPKTKILELGANPYFLTLLLIKYYKIKPKLANFFNKNHSKTETQTIKSKKYKKTHSFKYNHFNLEINKFPYKSNSFNLVINCEILEHLTVDPVHAIREIYRILKQNGYILITTPNVNREENWLKLIKGQNIYDPYSGYGVYGRHNREYTINELRDILFINGFKILSSGSFYKKKPSSYFSQKILRLVAKKIFKNEENKDHIFVLAQKRKRSKTTRPVYLYRSLK
ncbi:class I SAM-dependent methyltransferase [Patescibacteria group bacterium]|nr:class I SAM-dependent methyltransferase [Patescibacteria group bacterium]